MSDSNTGHETIGDISRRTGATYWTVDSAIRRIGVRPARRYGVCRVYDAAGVTSIEAELNRLRAKNGAGELVGAA